MDTTPTTRRTPSLAPLPDHRNTRDPQWLRAWARFEHVTTPLRERGLTCDVDYGLNDWLVYAWPPEHDAVFIIGSDDGWLVTYETPAEDRSSITVLYDSRPQSDASTRTHVDHLLTAVDAHLAQVLRRPAPMRPASQPMPPKTARPSHEPVRPTPYPVPRTASPQAKHR